MCINEGRHNSNPNPNLRMSVIVLYMYMAGYVKLLCVLCVNISLVLPWKEELETDVCDAMHLPRIYSIQIALSKNIARENIKATRLII